MSRLRIVTTSWDDGDPNDLKIADLLCPRGLSGTFYIPIRCEGHRVMSHAETRSLSSDGFEIGAHTVSHQILRALSADELDQEVRICKQTLEDVLSKEVQMFCYPRGQYNAKVIKALQGNGYLGARTTRMLRTGMDFDPFEMPTSVQAYPHTRSAYIKNLAKVGNVSGLCRYAIRYGTSASWVEIGRKLFDSVLREGGIWHLYGHSWEIDELGLWDHLKEMLDYVSGQDEIVYASNGEALSILMRELQPAR